MKYKITNKCRGKTRVNLENNEFIFVENKEQKIVESKPIKVTFGLIIEEIKETNEAPKAQETKEDKIVSVGKDNPKPDTKTKVIKEDN